MTQTEDTFKRKKFYQVRTSAVRLIIEVLLPYYSARKKAYSLVSRFPLNFDKLF